MSNVEAALGSSEEPKLMLEAAAAKPSESLLTSLATLEKADI